MNNRVTQLAVVAFALVVLLIGVSAYIRLTQGGLGCTPWPDCYALLGNDQQSFPIATVLHRLSASALGILALLLIVGAWQQRQQRGLTVAILSITALLAVLGVRSGGLLLPAVVLGNFMGGLLLAILLGWLLILQLTNKAETAVARLAVIAVLLLVTAVTILTGIGSSAFYGNAACLNLFDCGILQSPATLSPFMPLTLDAAEHAITPNGAATLQWLHRLFGSTLAVAFMGLLFAMFEASQRETRPALVVGLVVVLTALVTGLIATRHGLPISAAVIHSLSGLFVVLVLFRLLRRA